MAAPGADDRAAFLALSAELTGFAAVELEGTGVADAYRAWLEANHGPLTARLLDAWRAIERDETPPAREAALKAGVMADPELGPFARSVLVLWYTAQWTPLSPGDPARSFADAWAEGLVWRTGDAHATAAKPTGFASWATPPSGAAR